MNCEPLSTWATCWMTLPDRTPWLVTVAPSVAFTAPDARTMSSWAPAAIVALPRAPLARMA